VYQLIDDALDYAGDYDRLGKEPGADYRQGIATLPLVLAWRSASVRERDILTGGFGKGEPGDFVAVRDIVVRDPSFASCLATTLRQLDLVRRNVAALPATHDRDLLAAYVASIEQRTPAAHS
jgi:octaprenyl-diphosphate synthase